MEKGMEEILKGIDLEQMDKDIKRRMLRNGGRKNIPDINKGCVPNDKTNGEFGYLYLITYRDKHENKRPKGFEFRFYDKKIGVAYDVDKRVKTLSDELKLGRKNNLKKKGTLTPLKAHSLMCWKMTLENSYFIEFYLHKILEERHIEGEWYTDYEDDLLEIINYEMVKFVNNGADVEILILDEYMTENIHRFEKIVPTNTLKEEEQTVVIYRL